MNSHSDEKTQYLACALLVLALVAITAADHYNYRDLANAGTMILGIGGGLLTGKFMGQSTKSGDIINPPSETPIQTSTEEPKA